MCVCYTVVVALVALHDRVFVLGWAGHCSLQSINKWYVWSGINGAEKQQY